LVIIQNYQSDETQAKSSLFYPPSFVGLATVVCGL
jgi:hypothetical protein